MHTASTSTAGLIGSLANTLPGASPLRRQALHVMRQLNRPHPRAIDRKATDLLARLLDATDTPALADYDEDGLISSDFDTL